MAGPEWTLDDDNKTVTATFPTNPPVTLKLSTADVESMLKDLAELRWEMQPEVPDASETDNEDGPVEDPVWEISLDEAMENALLNIRDPRFGWLRYAIPKEEALKLGGYLQNPT